MTAIASGDMPDKWTLTDQVQLETYSFISEVIRLADTNALMFFAHGLLATALDDDIPAKHKPQLTDEEFMNLDHYLAMSVDIDMIIRKYLGHNYIQDYLDKLEDDDD